MTVVVVEVPMYCVVSWLVGVVVMVLDVVVTVVEVVWFDLVSWDVMIPIVSVVVVSVVVVSVVVLSVVAVFMCAVVVSNCVVVIWLAVVVLLSLFVSVSLPDPSEPIRFINSNVFLIESSYATLFCTVYRRRQFTC